MESAIDRNYQCDETRLNSKDDGWNTKNQFFLKLHFSFIRI